MACELSDISKRVCGGEIVVASKATEVTDAIAFKDGTFPDVLESVGTCELNDVSIAGHTKFKEVWCAARCESELASGCGIDRNRVRDMCLLLDLAEPGCR